MGNEVLKDKIVSSPQAHGVGFDVHDHGAVTDLFIAQNRGMVRLAGAIVKDHHAAQDVVQSSWEGLLRRKGENLLEEPAAYLRTIVVNTARREIGRTITREKYGTSPGIGADISELPVETVIFRTGDSLSIAEQVESAQAAMRIRACVKKLPDRQREIMKLKIAGFSNEQIAQWLGMENSTVRSHTRRARINLGRMLEDFS